MEEKVQFDKLFRYLQAHYSVTNCTKAIGKGVPYEKESVN